MFSQYNKGQSLRKLNQPHISHPENYFHKMLPLQAQIPVDDDFVLQDWQIMHPAIKTFATSTEDRTFKYKEKKQIYPFLLCDLILMDISKMGISSF